MLSRIREASAWPLAVSETRRPGPVEQGQASRVSSAPDRVAHGSVVRLSSVAALVKL